MLDIKKEKTGSAMTVVLSGRIDSLTAPELEKSLMPELEGVTDLVFDIADISYISSAGLRVLLAADKIVGEVGEVCIKNASQDVRDIFQVTKFDLLMNIQ